METEAPITNSSSRSQKILFLFGGLIIASLFIAFNIWVYKQATKGGSMLPKRAVLPVSRPSTTQKEPTSSSDSVEGPQPTPLPPPPIPPDPVPPVNVGPSFAEPTTSPTPSK